MGIYFIFFFPTKYLTLPKPSWPPRLVWLTLPGGFVPKHMLPFYPCSVPSPAPALLLYDYYLLKSVTLLLSYRLLLISTGESGAHTVPYR